MTGRFQSTAPPEVLAAWFGTANAAPDHPPRWNVAPTLWVPVIRFNPRTGLRSLDLLRWGLVPNWTKDMSGASRCINARSETIDRLPTFRDAFRRRRCIVPANGFYEWCQAENNRPYAVAPAEGGIFGLAGLWENWRDPETGEWIRTFAIVTGPANETLVRLHERMPVILDPASYPAWLGEAEAEIGELKALLTPYPAEKMRFWPVSPRVNSVRNDGPELLDRAD